MADGVRLPPQTIDGTPLQPPEAPRGTVVPAEATALPDAMTETFLAKRLVGRHGRDLRFCAEWARWLAWDGRRWVEDHAFVAPERAIMEMLEALRREALAERDPERRKDLWALATKAESESKRRAIRTLARYETAVEVRHTQLDREAFLLNVRNGTIDLRTGLLHAHRREDLLTKLAPVDYDPEAKSPCWDAFLNRIFGGDGELIGFVRRAVGYSITGDVGEQVFFLPHGSGANGKSTFLGALLEFLGDYAKPGAPDLLIEQRHQPHPTDLADLFGARLVSCQESGEGRGLNETRVKALTGGDPIKAHRMREDFWTFLPTHKLWLSTNHKPTVRGSDHAIWRRILLVPFEVTIPPAERDPNLAEKLRAELPGIARWAVQGCLEWQRERLRPPAKVAEATNTYREAEDRLGAFLGDCCVVDKRAWSPADGLFSAYKQWADRAGEFVGSQRALGLRLGERGFTPEKRGQRGWRGVGLKTSDAWDASAGSLPYARAPEDQPADASYASRTEVDDELWPSRGGA